MSTAVVPETGGCFHCGLELPAEPLPVSVEGVSHPTCCRGCQAVAQTIVDSGLGTYYRTRSALPPLPQFSSEALATLRVYDLPEVQRSFVREGQGERGEREAAVLLEGITCAACVWLIEQRLSALPGVRSASVNYSARRARVRWDPAETRFSAILAAINGLGYTAHPYDSTRSDDALRTERRALLWRLFVSAFGMMQVMMYAVPVYIAEGTMTADIVQLMRIAGLVLTVPVVAWAATPFYAGAWRALKNRSLGMDVPITIGILAAFGASAGATLTGTGEVYFDSVSMFVFLLLAARYVELIARTRAAAEQERLVKLVPATAERLDRFPQPQRCETVAVAVLRPGDIVLVRAGATIPADGIVLDGTSACDESLLTGESRSVWKAPGERLTGGALNKHAPLVARVEAVGEQTILGGIVTLMDRAQSEKPHIACAADRAARAFVAFVLLLSIGAAAAWYSIDPSQAFWVAITILVVSCPCALSLATPVALTAATGALYRSGALVTRGHAVETLANATHYVFDKTGTLTSGAMTLVGVIPLASHARDRCLDLAAAVEATSEHPIGKAIVAAAGGARIGAVENLLAVPGKGLDALIEGSRVRIGTPQFVAELHGLPAPNELLFVSDDVSPVLMGDEQGWIALFTMGETPRSDARRVIAELNARGIVTTVLSGDCTARVQRLAHDLGIASARGEARPADKVEFVRDLQRDGAVVVMIGDGVNDAPVLAQAQVSVALAEGAELAQNGADIILTGKQLAPLARAAGISRQALRIVRQNLGWATAYNLIALPLAAGGLVTPLAAAAGMSLSSLVVVLNALRLVAAGQGPDTASDAADPANERTGNRTLQRRPLPSSVRRLT
jgi:Cu2+-exporting ATPase